MSDDEPRVRGGARRVLEGTTNAVLVVSAIVVVGLMVRREFASSGARVDSAPAGQVARKLTPPAWDSVLAVARPTGEARGSMRVVAFADVECPFCKRFDEAWSAMPDPDKEAYSLSIAHLPLPQHKFAKSGVVALECAIQQGHLDRFLRVVYDSQSVIGLSGWSDFARWAGMPQQHRFDLCTKSDSFEGLMSQSMTTARSIGVTGTPGVVVEGYLLSSPPTAAALSRIRAARARGIALDSALREAGFVIR